MFAPHIIIVITFPDTNRYRICTGHVKCHDGSEMRMTFQISATKNDVG